VQALLSICAGDDQNNTKGALPAGFCTIHFDSIPINRYFLFTDILKSLANITTCKTWGLRWTGFAWNFDIYVIMRTFQEQQHIRFPLFWAAIHLP